MILWIKFDNQSPLNNNYCMVFKKVYSITNKSKREKIIKILCVCNIFTLIMTGLIVNFDFSNLNGRTYLGDKSLTQALPAAEPETEWQVSDTDPELISLSGP